MQKFTRKTVSLLLALIIMLANAFAVSAVSEFVPIRATFEDAGADVDWEEDGGRITVILEDFTFVFFAGSRNAYVNGVTVTLQNSVFIQNDRSFIHQADVNILMQAFAEGGIAPISDEAASFTSEEVVIGEGGRWPLGGTLTLPEGASAGSPVPAVLLVHGSGPGDRDLTVGTNRAFYDIADYLSRNGIAVLRYDKRTLVHGVALIEEFGINHAGFVDGGFTVWEETIEDAVLAAELLRADSRIDSGRIYMAGISLGGMLAPRIHASGGDFAGLIMLAGSPRLLPEIIADQERNDLAFQRAMLEPQAELLEMLIETEDFDMLRALDPATQDMDDDTIMELLLAMHSEFDGFLQLFAEAEEAVEAFLVASAAVVYMSAEEALDASVGVWPAYVLRDMALNPTPDLLAETTVPMLILHGDNDLQIFTDADFMLYQELLGYRDNVVFRLYPGLNHFFMPSVASSLAEAAMEMDMIPAQVYYQVLRDIVDWVLAH